jgi:hypothetical protein
MPWHPHPRTPAFLDLLASHALPARYYAFIDAYRSSPGPPAATDRAHLATVLDAHSLTAKYFAKEEFFRHVVMDSIGTWWFHLTFRAPSPATKWGGATPGTLELGLYLKTPLGDLGGTLHGLALTVAQRSDALFERSPSYPRIAYVTEEELHSAVAFSADLFQRLRAATVESGPW